MRHSRIRSSRAFACSLIAAISFPLESAPTPESTAFHDATVFVKVVRQLDQGEVVGCGTGFAIHPDGFLITRRSTVAPTVRYHSDGALREIDSPVARISVVVTGGPSGEAELPARLVADDPQLDLALLKINRAFSSPLRLATSSVLHVDDEVTVVGFGLAGADASRAVIETSSKPVPQPWSARGRVTGVHHTRTARGSIVETDIEVLPSHCGAPMLDADDRVVGVVAASSAGTAEATSVGALQTFVDASAFRVVMSPPGIHPDLDRMTVDIIPLLGNFDRATGTVCLEGRDLRRTYGRLERTDFGYRAEVATDDRMFGVTPPDSYTATIEIRTAGTPNHLKRRFRVPATDTQTVFEHSPEVYAVDPGPYIPGTEPGLSEYAEHLRQEGSSLADAGGDSELRRSPSGSLVIDQSTISSFVGAPAEVFSELESDDDKALAARFEIVFNEFCDLTSEHMVPIPSRRAGMSDSQYRRLIEQHVARIGEAGVASWASYLSKIAGEADSLHTELRQKRIGRCPDGKWRKSNPECTTPGPDDCS